jgi:DNA-binding LacI/PurR family transcriptional regulator
MATIKDIAKRAGVAPSVVSRALNHKYGVKETTRKLIFRIAEEIDYYPNAAARSLVTRKRETIGIFMADISQPYYSQIIKGMEYAASQTGYTLLFSNSFESLEHGKVFSKMVESGRVDGLIIVGSNNKDKNFIPFLIEREVPFVLVERNFSDPRVHCIWVDNIEGSYLATKYLIEKGHRRIAHISGNLDFQVALDRLEGYKKALAEYEIPFAEELIATGKFFCHDGYTAMKELLSYEPRCTAVFVSNDSMAYGALQALHEAGIKVPDNMAVIGYDDLEFSTLTNPPLTTIRQPRYEMGSKALETLIKLLQKDNDDPTPIKICLTPELTIRFSA